MFPGPKPCLFTCFTLMVSFFTLGQGCDGPWSSWSKCNDKCTRSRTRLNKPHCPNIVETQMCLSPPCCVPYEMTPWSAWGSCSVKCGKGTKTRSRDVAQTGTCVSCPPTTQSASCSNNCEVSSWSAWGACSQSCGAGYQTRYRSIIQTNGCPCPACSETQKCYTKCCPKKCKTCTGWPFPKCYYKCCSIISDDDMLAPPESAEP